MNDKTGTEGLAQQLAKASQHLRASDPASALRIAETLPDGQQTQYLKALSLSALCRFDEADALFQRALSGAAQPGEVLSNHANMWLRAGRADLAVSLYEKAAKLPSAPANVSLSLARALLLTDRLAEALAILRQHLSQNSQDSDAWHLLGNSLKADEQFDEARQAYDKAVDFSESSVDARLSRAHLSRMQGNKAGAWADLRAALNGQMNNVSVVLAAARQLARDGEVDSTKGAYQRALGLNPARQDVHAEYNRFLWEVGHDSEYLSSYRWAAGQVPSEAKQRLLLEAGFLAARADQKDVARAFFRDVLVQEPQHRGSLLGLAQVADEDDRDRAWEKAMAVAGDDPDIRLGFAWHLLNRGEALAAEKILADTVPRGSKQLWYAYDSTAARILGRDRYEDYYDLDRLLSVRELEVPSHFGTLSLFLEAIDEALAPLFVRKVAPPDQSLFGGQQTLGALWDTANSVLLELKRAMISAAEAFWQDLSVAEGHPLFRTTKKPLRYGGSWSVRLTSGGGHTDHIHTNGLFSSANYIKVPRDMTSPDHERAGYLRMGRPNLENLQLGAERFVKPEAGCLILFPSYMWHGVEPFQSETPRITTPADFVELT